MKKAILRTATCAVALCMGVLAPQAASGPAAAASPGGAKMALPGEVPRVPADVARLGAVPSSLLLHIDVGLAGQNPSGLADEVAAVSTPGSPTYHHYLTSTQFAATYGPSAAEVRQVRAALLSEGLTVGSPTPGSTLLPVSGNARTMSLAFGTPLESIRLPSHVASMVNTAPPEIPSSLAGEITGIIGLSGLAGEHSMLRRNAASPTFSAVASAAGTAQAGHATPAGVASGPQACAAATGAAGTSRYTSTQLANAYGLTQLFAQGRSGIGQTIGIVEFEKFSSTDIATFEACYGLSNPVRTVVVDGTPSGPLAGSGEAALDIELAAVNAPSASLIVYEAPNETSDGTSLDLYNRIASDDQAQVVSTSWGFCEQDNEPGAAGQESTIYQRMAVQGQTVVAASGDSGSEDCFDTDRGTELAVDDPGSQPDVLSVGGTSLVAGSVGTQSVWNDCQSDSFGFCQDGPGNGAGGGGYSTIWPRPSWQPASVSGAPALDQRSVPDLSLDADPADGVTVYFGGWGVFGGTDADAPSIAAFLADTNQGCNSTVGMLGPALYASGGGGGGDSNFTDVTAGNNDFTGTNSGKYPASSGYDLASGLGTPQEQNLAVALQGADGCPSVSGVSGTNAGGGGSVTITGGGLADAATVTFGAAGLGTIVSQTETSLVVVPPAQGKATGCVNVTVTNPQGTSAVSSADSFAFNGSSDCSGYRFVASDGGIFDFGSAAFEGSTGNIALAAPIVGMADTADGGGYWLAASDGGIFTFGSAPFFGSMGATHLNMPIVGIVATPDGGGYWLVASDGGIFAFGDARYFGSTGGVPLNRPIVGMAATTDGGGYWLVASDGGIFAFGDATYFGSTGGTELNRPIVAMAATPNGGGYWLVASDGGIFTFGNAQFFGSTGAIRLNEPIVGMAAAPGGAGYWLVASDGGIFTFGSAPFFGSTGAIRLNRPIVGMAAA